MVFLPIELNIEVATQAAIISFRDSHRHQWRWVHIIVQFSPLRSRREAVDVSWSISVIVELYYGNDVRFASILIAFLAHTVNRH